MTSLKKFWLILDKKQRSNVLILVFLTTLGALLEAAGVGLVVPFVSIVMSNETSVPDFFVNLWPYLGGMSRNQFAIWAVVLFLIFYFVKSAFLVWLVFCQSTFFYTLQEKLSVRVFSSYLEKDYIFHLENNSGKLLSNTITETAQFSQGFTAALILALNDILIITMIVIVLLVLEPVGAIISITLLGSMSLLLLSFSKSRAMLWGQTRQKKEQERIKWAQQGLNGVKEIKLHDKSNLFLNNYHKKTISSLTAGRNQSVLQNLPKISLELVTISVLCLLVMYLFYFGDQSKLITIVSLFVAAAFKLLPTISRLVQNIQTMLFNIPVISLVYNELFKDISVETFNSEAEDKFRKEINFQDQISVNKISFFYQEGGQRILDSISLQISKGEMIAIVGESGAGKSTLIDCILGLLSPTSGSIEIDGEHISERNLNSWQKKIGYVPQTIYLLDASLRDNIAFGLYKSEINEKKLENAIKLANLSQLVGSLPNGLDTFVGERGIRLSGGQRQRVGIARALYDEPSILVFDEATSALDTKTEGVLMKEIETLSGQRTIIIIAHRLSTIKNCDRVYKLTTGELIDQNLSGKIG